MKEMSAVSSPVKGSDDISAKNVDHRDQTMVTQPVAAQQLVVILMAETDREMSDWIPSEPG